MHPRERRNKERAEIFQYAAELEALKAAEKKKPLLAQNKEIINITEQQFIDGKRNNVVFSWEQVDPEPVVLENEDFDSFVEEVGTVKKKKTVKKKARVKRKAKTKAKVRTDEAL